MTANGKSSRFAQSKPLSRGVDLAPFRTIHPYAQGAAIIAIGAVWWHLGSHPWQNDAWNFWIAWKKPEGLYGVPWLADARSYTYSPAFAQAWWPLTLLPWDVVWPLWVAFQLGALVWMLTPIGALIVLAFPWPYLDGYGTAAFATTANGNPMILAAAAITLGLTRWPAAFAFVLLTKVSAGVGLLYFVLRQEWSKLAMASGVTALIVIISFVAAPHLWIDWLSLLWESAARTGSPEALAKERFVPPLFIRGPVGLGIVVLAGARRWPSLVPVGCFLALPDVHLGGFAVLAAVPAVWLRTHGYSWARLRLSVAPASRRGRLR